MTCLRLTRQWQTRFRQHVVALQPDTRVLKPAFDELRNCQLTIAPERHSNTLAMWWWLRSLYKADSPDALIMHVFGVPHLIAASAARTAGINLLAVKAGNPPPDEAKPRRRWAAIASASRLLGCPIASCSTSVDEELRNLGARMPEHSRPLPNGIDVASIAARAAGSRQKRGARPFVIGMVARLDAIKDHRTLLQAMSIVRLQVPACELWIIGDGVLRAELEDQARSLGVADCTKFLGDRSDIPELLGQMDVYAFSTTRAEGFGIALIEAMAAGVPIIASDVPACREVLADGEAGLLVSPGQAHRLAEGIVELLFNHSLAKDNAAAATVRVRREYSIENCAARWEALLFHNAKSLSSAVAPCAS